MSRPRVFVTREIPAAGLDRIVAQCQAEVWPDKLPPSREELLKKVVGCEGLLTLLTDTVENNQLYIPTVLSGAGTDNTTGDPGFVNGYFNGALNNEDITEFTTLSTAGAFDEGGNFIQVAFSPLSLIDSSTGALLDYHVQAPSAAIDAGDPANSPGVDIDDDLRPQGGGFDIGADEAQ